MGMSFSGKKKVAAFLKEKYEIEVIIKDNLLNEALEYVK